ncbi:MAG: KUP/HAK/KT family potassium transporter [Flavobacteriales bacterium]
MSTQHKLSTAGLLVTLGIIYGDIGTSPLYVMKSIVGDKPISEMLIYGGISCVFWTLTIQTTIKYIWMTLRADNKGEGGIFSLFSLVKRRGKWLFWPAMIGAATLLCDGIITPPISVASAVEGLKVFDEGIPVMPIVLAILTGLFMIQRYGTKLVGVAFGPIMLIWFSMLAVLGTYNAFLHPEIFNALNPKYAYDLLANYPKGFWLLGAVFLCTTGAEALYSDLGHCGRANIRVTWIFVKTALILNYMGQGAWLMQQTELTGRNPFFEIMPEWFLLPGVIVATVAAVIASQALISGSFTLIGEAINLNFWPRVAIKFPTETKGQLYIPSVNWLLWAGCIGVMLYFKESAHMEAAYGLFITVAMLMTTLLLSYYLIYHRHWPFILVAGIASLFFAVELSFFIANSVKLKEAWMMLIVYAGILMVMYVTIRYRKFSNERVGFISLDPHIETLRKLSVDTSVPKYATHLVYMTKASFTDQVEKLVIDSILEGTPKRADVYWFLHVDRTNEPYTMEYDAQELVDDLIIKVNIKLGFRVQAKVHNYFCFILQDLAKKNHFNRIQKPEPYGAYNNSIDVRFVVLQKYLSVENELGVNENFIFEAHQFLKSISLTDIDAWGLEENRTSVEKVSMVVKGGERCNLIMRGHKAQS